MRIKDKILQRKIDAGIVTPKEAEKFKVNAILKDGWWTGEGPIQYQQLRGLGDVVARITNKLNINTCNKCKKRQAKLNNLLPFKER